MKDKKVTNPNEMKKLWKYFLMIIVGIYIGHWVFRIMFPIEMIVYVLEIVTFLLIGIAFVVYYKKILNNYWGILLGILALAGYIIGTPIAVLIFYIKYLNAKEVRQRKLSK